MLISAVYLIALSVLSHPAHRKCGTMDLSEQEILTINENLKDVDSTQGFAATVIPTVFHVITSGSEGDISDSNIEKSMQILNDAYASAGFEFQLYKILRTDNAEYFKNLDGAVWEAAGRELREGDKGTLNIFSANLPSGILGIAQFPSDYTRKPKTDAVRCATGTYIGGNITRFNEGDTLVHEVGHWMGLYHTFQGGCFGSGDGVADTPAVGQANYGCPVGQDSCAGGGPDLIKNYMDYTDDSCMDSFTLGQEQRMRQSWNIYRSGGSPPTTTVSPTITSQPTATSTSSPTNQPLGGKIEFPAAGNPSVTGILSKYGFDVSYDLIRMSKSCEKLKMCWGGFWNQNNCVSTVVVNGKGEFKNFKPSSGSIYIKFETYSDVTACNASDSPGWWNSGYQFSVSN